MLRDSLIAFGLFFGLLLLACFFLSDRTGTALGKDLEGDWQQSAVVKDGTERSAAQLTTMVFTIRNDAMTFNFLGRETRVLYKIDAARNPKAIDFTSTSGFDNGQVTLAIYVVKDDELLICESKRGTDRPPDFSAREGSGRTLITMKRVRK